MRVENFTADSGPEFRGHSANGRARLSSARRRNRARTTPESQRDSGLQPRVARNELPWVNAPQIHNPNGVAARRDLRRAHPEVGERPLTAGARAARPQVRPEASESSCASPPICREPRLPTASGDAQRRAATPLGLKTLPTFTQGSSFLATLGWRPQSRWDCSARRALGGPYIRGRSIFPGWS